MSVDCMDIIIILGCMSFGVIVGFLACAMLTAGKIADLVNTIAKLKRLKEDLEEELDDLERRYNREG